MKHTKSESHEIELQKNDVAYIKLEKFTERKVSKSVRLTEVIPAYTGADIVLDFSEENVLIGIEILNL